jgi:hypothetical protein
VQQIAYDAKQLTALVYKDLSFKQAVEQGIRIG